MNGAITLHDNAALTSIAAFGSLAQVDGLEVATCDSLVDLSTFAALRVVDGDLVLDGNTSLTDVSALSGIEEIHGDLILRGNTSLADADAQALVTAIGEENVSGTVTLEDNGG